MRLLIAGGARDCSRHHCYQVLDKVKPDVLLVRGVRGADSYCRDWALLHNVKLDRIDPTATVQQMLRHNPDATLIFPGGGKPNPEEVARMSRARDIRVIPVSY